MIRTLSDDSGEGSWFQTKITQASGIVSDIYQLPPMAVYAIAAEVVGSGTLAFSIDAPADLPTGTFSNWDGSSQINLGVTGFKFTTTTASGIAKVTVKTFEGS
jgi:hypothetical protein